MQFRSHRVEQHRRRGFRGECAVRGREHSRQKGADHGKRQRSICLAPTGLGWVIVWKAWVKAFVCSIVAELTTAKEIKDEPCQPRCSRILFDGAVRGICTWSDPDGRDRSSHRA